MKNAKYKECEFSVDLLPYMYGELATNRISAFESHIAECSGCTDEFAELAAARFEVYEWKQIEFQPLATPVIAIPYGSEPAISWLGRMREVFTSGWAVPAAAFAGLAIVAASAALFTMSESPTNQPVTASLPETPAPAAAPAPVAPNSEPVVRDGRDATPVEKKRYVAARRTSATPRTTPSRAVQKTPRQVNSPPPGTATVASVRNAPTLNDFPENEDTSLRLAELFNDVGGTREND